MQNAWKILLQKSIDCVYNHNISMKKQPENGSGDTFSPKISTVICQFHYMMKALKESAIEIIKKISWNTNFYHQY